jgi:glutamate decarboxylase
VVVDLLPHVGDSEPETREFLNRMTEILMDFLHKTFDRSSKILDFHHPEQLLEIIDLSLPNQPKNIDQLLADCRDTLTYQVKTGSNEIQLNIGGGAYKCPSADCSRQSVK